MAGAGETTSLEPGDDIYGYNSYYGTLVDVEIEPGSSLLALLWLPPSLMIIASIFVYAEYAIQGWTPAGHTINEKWTPAQNREAMDIKHKYDDAVAKWHRENPDSDKGAPQELHDTYVEDKRGYKERNAIA